MTNKGNKCCCGDCPEDCVTKGSIRTLCDFCLGDATGTGVGTGECNPNEDLSTLEVGTPRWYLMDLSDDFDFACCFPTSINSGTTIYLLEDITSSDCAWYDPSGGNTCDGVPFDIYMIASGLDPGDVLIYFDFGTVGTGTGTGDDLIVFKNKSTWDCLCTNFFIIDEILTTKTCDVTGTICLDPVDECCRSRIEPLPSTLTATFVEDVDCICGDGVTVPLKWDGVNDHWCAYTDFCGDELFITLRCDTTIPPLTDTWTLDISSTGGGNGCWTTQIQSGDSDTLGVDIDSFVCEPLEIVWAQTSHDGCCSLPGSSPLSLSHVVITE